MIYKWVGMLPIGLNAKPFKKDTPKTHFTDQQIKIDFGSYGVGWALLDYRGDLIFPDGRRMPVLTACLHTPGWVIGFRDLTAANSESWSHEWRGMMMERIEAENREKTATL